MNDFALLDPHAPTADNVSAVLSYVEERGIFDADERHRAATACERDRARISRGNPPLAVLRSVERGVAPAWVIDTLRERFPA